MAKFIPKEDYMLVKTIDRQKSSILAVITNQEDRGTIGAMAEVIAVGPGKTTKRGIQIPLECKVGDKVYFGGEGLGCINFPKFEDCLIIQEADVVGIVETH